MIQDLMKGMVSMVMKGGAKKVAKAVSSQPSITNSQIFFSLLLFTVLNYLLRAFIFMIVVNALMPRIKEMHPQMVNMREISFGESILFVILFSVIFQ